MEGKYNHGYNPDEEILQRNGVSNYTKSVINGSSYATDNEKIKPKVESEDQEIKAGSEEEEKELPPVGCFSLFRYASSCDMILLIVGAIAAIIASTSRPAIMIIFGQLIDKMIYFSPNQNYNATIHSNLTRNNTISKEEFLRTTTELCIWNAGFGVFIFICNYIFVSFYSVAAANQAFRIRCLFMKAVLKQDMAWYDTHQTGGFATRITGDLTLIQDGMGEKVAICINYISTTFLCIGCGIYYGWKLALVILSLSPVLAVTMAFMSKILASVTSQEQEAYSSAGAVAVEVLSSIRTVVAFGGQQKEIQRYEACLIPATKKGIKRGLMTALSAAITWFCIFSGYALAFWYGIKLILEEIGKTDPEYTGGKLTTVFFNIMSASMFIGQTAPYFEAFALARGAAAKIFSIIDREPSINSSLDTGLRSKSMEGHIRLRDVYFNYPSRPTVPVLTGLSLEVKPGETVALVGSSGCGKSTIVQLLLRFYDVDSGSVEIDGIDVKDLNLGWLRDRIGLVGQEPVLFSTTIEENIRMGRSDASPQEIIQAAKIANAHDFIQGLPKKYQTSVGERGTQLSGGQKQRIAIARALVRNPRILLLDEATSALDTESEAVVQAALDKARDGRTTIVVAHRLSTIRNADKILVLDDGVVKEAGTHDELMEAKGLYYRLVVTQTKEDEEDENEVEDLNDIQELERRTSALSIGSDDGHKRHSVDRQVLNRQISTIGQKSMPISRQISTTSGKGKEEEQEEVDPSEVSQKQLWKLASREWPYALIGGISALIMGVPFTLFAIIFGNILGILSEPVDVIKEKSIRYCLLFLGMAAIMAVFGFLQVFMFSIAGSKLTFRLRKMVFTTIISQDIAFFDNSKNSVGSLCSRLSSDAANIQGATGFRISSFVQALSTMAVSIFIGLFYEWKIGLVVLAFVPFVLVATALEAKIVRGHMHKETKGMEGASKVATEAIENIRTVASLHREEHFYTQYRDQLLRPHRKSRLKSHARGAALGFGIAMTFFAYAASMYYGSYLVANEGLKYADLLKIVQGVLSGAMMIGQAVAFAPDYEKAKIAAVRIFRLLELRPTIDAFSQQGTIKPSIEGSAEFSSVHFSYPTRPQVRVLKGLTALVKPGQTVALVGPSGCGKSTCVQLLERFYDPTKGKVMVDSDDISDLNVSNHRSHLALVSQEPVLFGRTIAENIAYGDNNRQPDMNEIIAVARQANIHGFISNLPRGYDTSVGDRGTQLSGGQKQRIAIARALIRNPKILLLDEATSALDTESEKVVQEALEKARSGRTCLVIAHRLSTIQNADLILVLHQGKIVEKGTHQELINKKGIYYGLHNTQIQNSK